jgi:hypothetical protein
VMLIARQPLNAASRYAMRRCASTSDCRELGAELLIMVR